MSDLHTRLKDELPRLMRYGTALTGDADQALDLGEDTILEALAADQGAPSGVDFRVWLLTILHRHRRNPFRQIDPLAEIKAEAVVTLSALEQAMRQLPEDQRAALLLVGLEGMSYRETGVILGISLGAVRVRLARGRENLCRALGATNAVHRREAA